ncbi:MAG: SPFH domain-containing protein, partial [Gemmatimonadaceae bacterium]
MFREVDARPTAGIPMLLLVLVLLGGALALTIYGARTDLPALAVVGTIALTVFSIALAGFFTVAPNDAKVLTLFGNYVGTVKAPGLWFANPFLTKKEVSLRVRNFETAKLKVNDAHSNPVEIGAIVVWRVIDAAEALFEVNDYVQYVAMQSEAALRTLASAHPYDAHG